MPELPEVETVKRGLEKIWPRKRFAKIQIHNRNLRTEIPLKLANELQGEKVSKILRRGKYLVIICEDTAFVLHLGMSGSIKIYNANEEFTPQKHDHVIFKMHDGYSVAYNDPRRFGMLYLTDKKAWEKEKPFCLMGPEPLENNFNGDVLYERLKKKKAPIKAALLDQNIVAGLGNIYVCEALYRSRISPKRRADMVTEKESDRLAREIRNVLNDAIESGGSSLRDHKLTDGSLAYFQHHFDVYDREDEICKSCRKKKIKIPCVKRIVQAGRSTFYCSNTQV